MKLVRGFDSIRKLMMPQPGDEAAVVLLSDESISATPAWVAPCGGIDSFAESLDTFHALFRPIGYVVAFRQHASWIRSMYCQYLHEGGTGLFSEFYRLEGGGLLELDLTPWRSRYIKLLTKVPAESVFVYLQEDLLASPRTVLASLRCFLLRSAHGNDGPRERTGGQGVAKRGWHVGDNTGEASVDFALPRHRHNVSGHLGGYPTLRRFNKVLATMTLPRTIRRLGRTLDRWGVTPRRLCQKSWLPRWWAREFAFDGEKIDRQFSADWEYIRKIAADCYARYGVQFQAAARERSA
ncbi:MAG: hypothetical protein FJ295_14350 [Planctomycetes bacterium]|nr:hypothetical protein [Planctomycetota bacterium]